MPGQFSSFCYYTFLRCFKLLPVPIDNKLLLFIRFIRFPNSKFYKDLKYKGQMKVKTGDGFFFMYASGGTIENEIFWKGLNNAFEPETVWIWKLLCPVSETIIDIGANTGMYSLIAKQINPTSKVYCFEPAHKTFKELVKNIQCNHFDIKAFDIAVSNTDSEKIFYDVFDEHQLSASLSPEKLKHNPSYVGAMNEYLVKTTTLDSFIQNRKINQVDLIKIDVEMHEPEVFDGMMHIMKFHRPSHF